MGWVHNKTIGLMVAFSKVEKNSLSQERNMLSDNASKHSEKETGKLMHDLLNNVVSQEVKNLRWRTYKVFGASKNFKTTITSYDENDLPIVSSEQTIGKATIFNKFKFDEFDSYPVEYIYYNQESTLSLNDISASKDLIMLDNPTQQEDGSETIGTIDGLAMFSYNKGDFPIIINRMTVPNFNIENYTKKIVVRKINSEQRLLEFYVSKYPDEYNRRSRLFLSALKKAIDKPYSASMLEINSVEYVTYLAIGVNDFLHYKYEVEKFDKIIEFDGSYVIKFICNVTKDGVSVIDKYKEEGIEKKYANKVKKNNNKTVK
jgi:hypothetical protein